MQISIPVDSFSGKVVPSSFAWPGGYPIFYFVQEFGTRYANECTFCPDCIPKYLGSDDVVVAAEINWEDPDLSCESCGKRIESAYAEVA